MKDKPRWRYRFDTFKRAYILLQEACERYAEEGLEQIAKEGMIQRFEFFMELSWKTIKDYMEHKNFVFDQVFPSHVIKEAYAAKLITNGEDWLSALDDRNKMSHTYDFKKFNEVIERISKRYIQCFSQLYETLSAEIMEDSA